MATNVLVDTRVPTKPKAWACAIDDWKRFKSATLDQPIRRVDLTQEDGVFDGQRFAVLAASLEDRALDQLINIEEGAGQASSPCHECEPKTMGHQSTSSSDTVSGRAKRPSGRLWSKSASI
eukprot:1103800-Amphidinium_carterae.5